MTTKGIVFYTASEVNNKIKDRATYLIRGIAATQDLYMVTCALKSPLEWGNKNFYLPITEKSPLTQFRQILTCLENMPEEIETVYFCEDDVLYNSTHFDFIPPTAEAYYYNNNIWKLWLEEEIATHEDVYIPLSGLVGDRKLMLGHYQRRVAKVLQNQVDTLLKGDRVEREGYSKHMGYEPGGHMEPRGVDHYPIVTFKSAFPIIDIRHDTNLTKGKRKPEDYRDPKWAEGWQESDSIPEWGLVKDIVKDLK